MGKMSEDHALHPTPVGQDRNRRVADPDAGMNGDGSLGKTDRAVGKLTRLTKHN